MRGLCIFAVIGLLFDSIVVGLFGPETGNSSDFLILGSAGLAFLVWVYSLYDVWRRAFGRYRESLRVVKYKHYRTGLIHYLGGDFEGAAREFKSALKLDDEDVDALYYLAVTYLDNDNTRAGRRLLKRCKALDTQKKWADEVGRYLRDSE
jgi:tetratricopeptide (TPR) repeat protein